MSNGSGGVLQGLGADSSDADACLGREGASDGVLAGAFGRRCAAQARVLAQRAASFAFTLAAVRSGRARSARHTSGRQAYKQVPTELGSDIDSVLSK